MKKNFSRVKRRQRRYRFELNQSLTVTVSRGAYAPEFINEWLHVYPVHGGATITLTPGYAWDGCSPKHALLDLFWIGTPDGVTDPETGLPVTYAASCVHDALCQFNAVPRKQADLIFYELLRRADFRLARLYYLAVRAYSKLTGRG